jgi:hypothetical protein
MNTAERRPLQVGDACLVLTGKHWGAVVQVEELPNRNHRHTYKVRHWVTRDHSYTFFCVRAELEYIEPAS